MPGLVILVSGVHASGLYLEVVDHIMVATYHSSVGIRVEKV